MKKLTPKVLRQAVGDAAADLLIKRFAGRRIPGASKFHVELVERYERVRQVARDKGFEAAAEQFGLSERQVRRIYNGF